MKTTRETSLSLRTQLDAIERKIQEHKLNGNTGTAAVYERRARIISAKLDKM